MPKNVALPDGRVVQFPDNMQDSDINAVLSKDTSANLPPLDMHNLPPLDMHGLKPYSKWDDIKDTASDLLGVGPSMGAAGTVGNTVGLISKLLHMAPAGLGMVAPGLPAGLGETLAPQAGINALAARTKDVSTPQNTTQAIGKGGEQIGELMLPGVGEEGAAAKISSLLPFLGKLALPAARVAYGAGTMGAQNAMQGGDVGTGALAGAGGGVLGEGLRAIAPKLVETALGITGKASRYGATPAEAVLAETSGFKPGKIAASAGAKASDLTGQLQQAVSQSTAVASRQPAIDVVDNAISAAQKKNVQPVVTKLQAIRSQLTHDITTGQPFGPTATPEEILAAKRGVGDLINSWTREEKTGVQKVLPQVYHALDSELDRTVPGADELNQRISSLIPAKKAALIASEKPSALSRILGRSGIGFTGALGAGVGYQKDHSATGALEGGVLGMLLPELVGSRTGQMMLARGAAGPIGNKVTLPFLRGLLLQLNQPDETPQSSTGK